MKKPVSFIICIILSTILFFQVSPTLSAHVDPALKPYYDEVISIIDSRCTKEEYFNPGRIRVEFKKMSGDDVGVCMRYGWAYVIYVDKKAWDRYDRDTRFQLMAHEVAHCALGLMHSENPKHFMFDTMYEMDKVDTVLQLEYVIFKMCKGIK